MAKVTIIQNVQFVIFIVSVLFISTVKSDISDLYSQSTESNENDLDNSILSVQNSSVNFDSVNNSISEFPENTIISNEITTTDKSVINDTNNIETNLTSEGDSITKEQAMEKLLKIFGLPRLTSLREEHEESGPPPEFMIDLYNTITDAYGVTRAKNPYDAHIVRSFIERDNSLNDFFYFNISGISETEFILEAELHVHRWRTPHEDLHASLYLTPFYILSVYQVLDPSQLQIPDLHKLLGVHYVPALGSGWEVFNVKQAVLQWMANETTNHGLLVTASSLGGDRVPIRFSRRYETLHSKQPILVLFNRDSNLELQQEIVSKSKPLRVTPPPPAKSNSSSNATTEDEEDIPNIPTSSLENPRFHHALLFKDSIRHPNSVNRFRSRRSKNQTETAKPRLTFNSTGCDRHDLFVRFETIGWSSWVISPKGYNAFYCDGSCRFPLGQQMKPSNHATVQSIVHELNLSAGIQKPCCVPNALLPISLLYYDDYDNVVLRQFTDMVAESCGCQ